MSVNHIPCIHRIGLPSPPLVGGGERKGHRLMMREMFKQLVIGTPLEPVARKLYLKLTGNRNTLYDEQTVDIMRRVLKKDSNCIDVGCHKGSILKEIVRLSPDGCHFAVEPIPELFDDLVRAFPRVQCFNSAVSDETGFSSFNYVASDPAYSGLKKRRYPREESVIEIRVKTERLDDIIPQDVRIDFIKVDVEGAELNVFRGAPRILSNKPILVFEHGLGAADCYGHRPEHVFDFLSRCGLRISPLGVWLAGLPPLHRDEFVEQFEKGLNFCFVGHS